ncbi:MAG: phosphatidate cytidylyltransferase [Rhizobiaceae bacterium]|nr:phosphatidate cytidylyltransferase [Rhizobiaceae bacterium]
MSEAGGRSNLQLRVMSAVVLAVGVLALTWWGGTAFRLFAVALGGVIFYEWSTLAGDRHSLTHRICVWLLVALPLGTLALGFDAATVFLRIAAAAAAAALLGAVLREGYGLAVGLAYAAVPAAALAFLRDVGAPGLWALLFLFAAVWATDIAAYFAGRFFGGPKLAPAISPSKTWSGAIGGAVAAVAAGTIVALLGPASMALLVAASTALALSVVSQAGDLFESAYKRRHGAKDSSRLIPGHGGVMDRVDGLIAAAVALYVTGAMLAGLDNPSNGLFSG